MFRDRRHAGRLLAERLRETHGDAVVVLGLPRGGVPVADEVASALSAPLDVIVARKLGVPFQPELAMGAVGEEGATVVDRQTVREARITQAAFEEARVRERGEVERLVGSLRGGKEALSLAGRTAVIVDDGIATGSTARAACLVARARGASRVVLAVPVAPPGWERRFRDVADELVAVETPPYFYAVGQFYDDFGEVSDKEVVACLEPATRPSASGPVPMDCEVALDLGTVDLGGRLAVPPGCSGIVLFAHGSGSSRHSPRNRYVAKVLNDAGIGTLLFDLLDSEEEKDRQNVFDVELLSTRLVEATAWLRGQDDLGRLPLGYFGASTGSAAALSAAAADHVSAVVSRGGRPDLAGPSLALVRAPTLLIVGSLDDVVLSLNRQARHELCCESELAIVEGATHLFEEPGTLAEAAELARDWYRRFFTVGPKASGEPAARPPQ